MHYFGNPGHTQSMIVYMILSEYFWKFPVKNCIVRILLACPIRTLNYGCKLHLLLVRCHGLLYVQCNIFVLQKLYYVKNAHKTFVTGLAFSPSTVAGQIVTNHMPFTLLSISIDNQLKIHQGSKPCKYAAFGSYLLWCGHGSKTFLANQLSGVYEHNKEAVRFPFCTVFSILITWTGLQSQKNLGFEVSVNALLLLNTFQVVLKKLWHEQYQISRGGNYNEFNLSTLLLVYQETIRCCLPTIKKLRNPVI